MKLVTFIVDTALGRFSRIGCVTGERLDQVIDLNAAYAWLLDGEGESQPQRLADVIVPPDMRRFIEMGDRALAAARQMEAGIADLLDNPPTGLNGATLVFSLDNPAISLDAPLPRPNLFRDFFAFEQHVAVGYEKRGEPIPEAWYEIPFYYKGNPNSFIGPDAEVHWPRYTRILDYELELGCVIGKKGRNIGAEDAGRYIFGYTIINDFSARDIQKKEMQIRLGPAKAKDFATAMGPWIVTADEVADTIKSKPGLRMQSRINGETLTDNHSGTAHFTFDQMIAHVSTEEYLWPGDVLASGTVGGGCGLEHGRWLRPDDVVELEIEKLGILRNKVVKEGSAS